MADTMTEKVVQHTKILNLKLRQVK